jgi:hypothetical protein
MTHNLVIQSLAPLSDAHHKPLLALSRGTRIVQTDDHALRIENANPRSGSTSTRTAARTRSTSASSMPDARSAISGSS